MADKRTVTGTIIDKPRLELLDHLREELAELQFTITEDESGAETGVFYPLNPLETAVPYLKQGERITITGYQDNPEECIEMESYLQVPTSQAELLPAE